MRGVPYGSQGEGHGFREIFVAPAAARSEERAQSMVSACMRKNCASCTIFSWAKRNCRWKRAARSVRHGSASWDDFRRCAQGRFFTSVLWEIAAAGGHNL